MAFKKTFTVSNETKNSFGFIVLTKGIMLGDAIKNCPCFYSHKTDDLPLGHWENFRVENKELLADLVIDGANDVEKTYIRKIENGDIKGATIGADPISWDFNNQTPVLTECNLFEISIDALPSNSTALALKRDGSFIKLSQENKDTIIPQQKIKDMKLVALKLGLAETATENEICTAIDAIQLARKNGEAFQTEMLKDADKDLTEENKSVFVELSKSSPAMALKFANANKKAEATETTTTAEAGKTVVKDVKVSALLNRGAANAAASANDGKDTYDYLQKHNAIELSRIHKEDYEKYKQLADDYSKGVRYTTK